MMAGPYARQPMPAAPSPPTGAAFVVDLEPDPDVEEVLTETATPLSTLTEDDQPYAAHFTYNMHAYLYDNDLKVGARADGIPRPMHPGAYPYLSNSR